MKTLKILILMVVSTAFLSNAQAQQKQRQGNWCHTDEHNAQLREMNPNMTETDKQFWKEMANYVKNNPPSSNQPESSPYIIPVVFHCITDNGQGYCSKADIDDQMLTINEDFQRLNGDASQTRALFVPYAMSMSIEFRLAHLDPTGNCTEGITRSDSPLSTDATDAVKGVISWDPHKYFNIWVVNSIDGSGPGIILGYAQFPYTSWGGGIDATYGVVVDNDYVSRTDRTLTHEIGHCLGLLHTFQPTWPSTNGCAGSGDLCADTPPAQSDTYGCSTLQNSCPTGIEGPYGTNVVDQIENYMSYDACQNMFSLDQKSRMENVLNSTSFNEGLDQLNTSANHIATGVANPYNPPSCAPIAEFSYNKEYICEGSSVTFTDDSYNGTPTAWSWVFAGGTPSASTAQNPTIVYNTAGVYSVTHQPSNANGSGSLTKSSIITVSSLTADYIGPFLDDFENLTTFNNEWTIENPSGGQAWHNNNQAATSGTRSVRLLNYFTNFVDYEDILISPSYDISTMNNKQMTFKNAFAKRSSGSTDILWVYYSINCGETWTLAFPYPASTLATVPITAGNYLPAGPGDWVTRTIDLTSIGNATNVRFKFRFESGLGNNLYIEDINLGGPNSIDELNSVSNFSIYPNPTNSNAQISFNLNKNIDNLNIRITNAIGQIVTSVINGQSFVQGKYTLNIDEQHLLSKGMYFIEFDADGLVKTEKLIVQ